MSEQLRCPICGKPTVKFWGNYNQFGLCKEHSKMEKNGDIVQCKECGRWHEMFEQCECQKLTCIICNEPSNGKHFCLECWKEYKNKTIYFKVKKCKDFEKLDAEYESDLICEDGHLVKSPYEKIIDNWLYTENIKHAYEKKIDVTETIDLTPDFYIPEYNGTKNIFVEFWGYGKSNIKYQQIKEYKLKIYPELVKKENIAVVYINKEEVDKDTYKKKIKYAEQGKIKQ